MSHYGINIPMMAFGALDQNSLMGHIGTPRIMSCYDQHSIMGMPSAFSRTAGLAGAAGLGFVAGSMMSGGGMGGLSELADSLGATGQRDTSMYGRPVMGQQAQQFGQDTFPPQQQNGALPMNNAPAGMPAYGQSAYGAQPQPAVPQTSFGMPQPAPASGYNSGWGTQQPFGGNIQPAYGSMPQGSFGAESTSFGGNTQPAYSSMPSGGFGAESTSFGSTQPAYGAPSQPAVPQTSFGTPYPSPAPEQPPYGGYQQNEQTRSGSYFNPGSQPAQPQPNGYQGYNAPAYSPPPAPAPVPQPAPAPAPAPLPRSNAPASFDPNAMRNTAQPAPAPAPLPRSNAPTSFDPNAMRNTAQPAPAPAPLPRSNAPASFDPNAMRNTAQPAPAPAPLPRSNAPTSFDPNAMRNTAQPAPAPAPLPRSNAPTSFDPNAMRNTAQPAPAPAPLPRSNAPTSFDPNAMRNTAQPAPAPAPPKQKIVRKRAPAAGKALVKGQKSPLSAGGPQPRKIRICLGWDTSNDRCELDASAFMLRGDGRVAADEWFVFYGQPESPDGSVSYKVFSEDPSSPDDAELGIDLSRVSPDVEKIAISVTIYEAFEKKLNFGMVPMIYARILDGVTGSELLRFELADKNSAVTALVVGELYRNKGEWKFNAVGSGVNRDLAGFCSMYGVDLE